MNANTEVIAAIDADLNKETEPKPEAPLTNNKVGVVLRGLGASVLVAASIAFMVQRWGTMDDSLRYLTFLAFTAILAFLGFVSGIKIKDDKGARTFFAVAAGLLVVNFAQLGALLYSTLPEASAHAIPSLLLWKAPSLSYALLLTAGAGVVLALIASLAFRILAREISADLTIAYLAANATLLIPTREPTFIGFVFLTAAAVAVYGNRKVKASSAARTREGLFTRFLLFVPAGMVVGRNLFLYGVNQTLTGLCLLSVGYVLLALNKGVAASGTARFGQVSGYSLGALGWLMIAESVRTALRLPIALEVPMIALPVAATLTCFSLQRGGNTSFEKNAAAIILTLSALVELTSFNSVIATLYCVIIGVVTASFAYNNESKALFFAGILCTFAGLLYQIKHAILLYSMSPWVSLAITGVAILIASSLFERYHQQVRSKVIGFHKQIKAWN